MYGVREFAAIINPPHATILAVGATRRAPVETEDGGVKFVSQMTVTLSCDHRVVDGALGAELLAAFKRLSSKSRSRRSFSNQGRNHGQEMHHLRRRHVRHGVGA